MNEENNPVPAISAKFEIVGDGLTGTTGVPVKRVERENDGSLTVVLDYWPKNVPAGRVPATPEDIALAREQYAIGSDDDIEVDEDACASADPDEETGSVWVQAWVYVRKDE